jgi:AraC family L-rhamnose operon regulatory protein RhaS
MELNTIGREFFPEAVIPLRVYKDLTDIPVIPLDTTFQIIIIEEGTGIININEERSIIQSPIVYFINELETVKLEKVHDIKLHIIYFQPKVIDLKFDLIFIRQASRLDVTDPQVQDLYWLNSFLIRGDGYANHYQLTQAMLKRLLQLAENIQDEFDNQRTGYWICRGRSFFLEMLCFISKFHTNSAPNMEIALESVSELFEDILLYIHTNYTDKLTLAHLVDTFNLNRTSLNNLFRISTGETVISYIIKLRIEISAMMLRDTGIPVKEIGFRVGYEDTVNFGRTFKKIKGCSPKQYREDNSWLLRLG